MIPVLFSLCIISPRSGPNRTTPAPAGRFLVTVVVRTSGVTFAVPRMGHRGQHCRHDQPIEGEGSPPPSRKTEPNSFSPKPYFGEKSAVIRRRDPSQGIGSWSGTTRRPAGGPIPGRGEGGGVRRECGPSAPPTPGVQGLRGDADQSSFFVLETAVPLSTSHYVAVGTSAGMGVRAKLSLSVTKGCALYNNPVPLIIWS